MMAIFGFRLSNSMMAAGLIAASGAAAFVGGWISDPAPKLGDVAQATRNDWRDLAPTAGDAAKDLAVLAMRRPWGVPAIDPAAAAAAAAAAASAGQGTGLSGNAAGGQWRVTGVMRQGDRYLAILTQAAAGQPPKTSFLQVGEKLPDGRALAAIDSDWVEVDAAAGRQRIRLYWPKT